MNKITFSSGNSCPSSINKVATVTLKILLALIMELLSKPAAVIPRLPTAIVPLAAECNFVHDSFTDEGSITCLNSNTVDTTVDNIAEPNNSGLSVNNYETFHIPSNGRVFNEYECRTSIYVQN